MFVWILLAKHALVAQHKERIVQSFATCGAVCVLRVIVAEVHFALGSMPWVCAKTRLGTILGHTLAADLEAACLGLGGAGACRVGAIITAHAPRNDLCPFPLRATDLDARVVAAVASHRNQHLCCSLWMLRRSGCVDQAIADQLMLCAVRLLMLGATVCHTSTATLRDTRGITVTERAGGGCGNRGRGTCGGCRWSDGGRSRRCRCSSSHGV